MSMAQDIGDPVEGTDWHVIYIGDHNWRITRGDGTTTDVRWFGGLADLRRHVAQLHFDEFCEQWEAEG